jgi:hypothetical protein
MPQDPFTAAAKTAIGPHTANKYTVAQDVITQP